MASMETLIQRSFSGSLYFLGTFLTSCVRTIFGDRSGGNPFAGGINFGQQVKNVTLGLTHIFTFQGGLNTYFQGGGAEQFDFGPKEYHVTLSFQQAAMGV